MKSLQHPITSNLWFNDQGEEAATFYTSIFPDASIGKITRYDEASAAQSGKSPGDALTVDFQLAGHKFVALNGGPQFTFNPSVSFFVVCETENEIDNLWENLSEGGAVLMPLEKQEWSEKYGWVADRYGLSWQLSLGKLEEVGQKITPALMFVGDQHGRAEEAVNRYTSIFADSDVDGILHYEAGEDQPEGTVKHAQFGLAGNKFMAMENDFDHGFTFNEAISFIVDCETQDEVDYYWEKFTADGGEESMCGWLKDPYGVSWQIVPTVLTDLLFGSDPEGADRAMQAMLQMRKLDIAALKKAYEHA